MTQSSKIENLSRLENFIKEHLERWHTPGLAIAIVKEGKVLYTQGFGKRSLEHDLDVTPETRFAIGSCTKAFTTSAMALLVDEGKLDWDRPVKEYLPYFKLYDSYASEHVTLRDLVTHRTGLPRHELLWYTSALSREELVKRLQYLPPNKSFRQGWQYQNLMYIAAGHLVEVVAGQSWESFVQQRLFAPLGMTSSVFDAESAREAENYASPYRQVGEDLEKMQWYSNWQTLGPAGSIHTNVIDMSKWILFHLQQGVYDGQRLISQKQMQEMHSPQVFKPEERKYKELFYDSYALGWSVNTYRGETLVRHGGNIDGFSSLTAFMPEKQLGLVVLTNHNSGPVQSLVAYYVLDCLLELETVDWHTRFKQEYRLSATEKEQHLTAHRAAQVVDTHPSHGLEAYTGIFEHPGFGYISITQEDARLRLRYNELDFELQHYHYDSFELRSTNYDPNVDLICSFVTDARGEISSCLLPLEESLPASSFVRRQAEQAPTW